MPLSRNWRRLSANAAGQAGPIRRGSRRLIAVVGIGGKHRNRGNWQRLPSRPLWRLRSSFQADEPRPKRAPGSSATCKLGPHRATWRQAAAAYYGQQRQLAADVPEFILQAQKAGASTLTSIRTPLRRAASAPQERAACGTLRPCLEFWRRLPDAKLSALIRQPQPKCGCYVLLRIA